MSPVNRTSQHISFPEYPPRRSQCLIGESYKIISSPPTLRHINNTPCNSWKSLILHYLQTGELPPNEGEAEKIIRKGAKYSLISGKLYRLGKATPIMRCLSKNDITLVLAEVHKGAWSSHNGRKALAHKLLRVGYYWPMLMKDNTAFINKWDKFQRHIDLHHALEKLIQSITFPWPFYQWGMDILGTFHLAPGQFKFLIVWVDYFTKWI